jgi:hypothetical protein
MTKRRPQKAKPRKQALRNAPIEMPSAAHDSLTGRDDPQQRYRIYRLCICSECGGSGYQRRDSRAPRDRCPQCRGEGKTLECIATAANPEGVGLSIVHLGMEGEFEGCPLGVLDTQGEPNKKWLVKPWMPSARNVSDAARTLAKSKGEK